MNFNKHILAAAVAAAMSTTSFSVFAEEEHIENPADETIIITASKYERSVDEVLASVAVLDRATIDKIQPLSVSDLLQTVTGIDVSRQGGAGQQASAYTRGTNSSHTLILVDGVRVGSATLGSTALANIPTQQIERVEIVKGPRASLYGSDAIGGVIQIFTRQLEGGEYQISGELGSDSFHRAGLNAGITHGDGATTFGVSHEKSDGFDVFEFEEPDDDGYKRLSVSLNGYQRLSEELTLSWVGRLADGENDFDDTFGSEYLNEAEYKNHVLQGKLNYVKDSWRHELLLSQYRDSSVSFGTNLPKSAADTFETRRHQVAFNSHFLPKDAVNWSLGGEFYREDIDGTSQGQPISEAYGEDSRDVYAVFAGALYQVDELISEASVRYDDVDGIDSETTYNASIGYHFTDTFFASVNYGTGFKAPSFNDLYYPSSPWSGGNPDLVSETSDSYEFLVRTELLGIKTQVSVYQSDIDDLIDWAPDENFFWQPTNIASAEIDGAEVSFTKDFNNADLNLGYSYVDAKDGNTGERLNRRARHTVNLSGSYAIGDWLFAANYGYHGSSYDNGQKMSDYQLANVSANYRINDNWDIQLKANNVFDEDYQRVNGYNTPGSEYFLQVNYKNF